MENILWIVIGIVNIGLFIILKFIKNKKIKEIFIIFQIGFSFLSIGFSIGKMFV